MGKKQHEREHYTITIVPSAAQKKRREFAVSQLRLGICILAAVLVFVGLVSWGLVQTQAVQKKTTDAAAALMNLKELQRANDDLLEENTELISKNLILSDTVNRKVEEEEARAVQEATLYVPSGIPVNGASTYTEYGRKSAEEPDADTVEATAETADADTMEATAETADAASVETTAETADANTDAEKEGTLDSGELMIEFSANTGAEVVAAGSGTVIYVGDHEVYGHEIQIDHGNGYISYYRTNEAPKVVEGVEILKGVVLFAITESDRKVGYQISYEEAFIDPMEIMEIYG